MQGDNISAVEGIQYCGGIPSVLWGITAVHVGDRLFSTVGDNSTVGDSCSTVEGIQYTGGITSVHVGDNISTTSVLWRVFSTVGDTFSTVGDTFSTVGDNISTVGLAQYSGDKDLKYYEFLKESQNLFQSLFLFEIRSTTSQDSIVDHG